MIGTRAGHMRIIGLLGQGGMGEVYLGFDERLHRRVALKAVRNEMRLSVASRERLLREARALSAIDHPNICRIYDYAEGPACDFLVLELVEGMTLHRAMEQGMSRVRKLRIARDIVAALAAAHRRGIVHRDLKPENVMITPSGSVKVLDFGIARIESGGSHEPVTEAENLDAAETLLLGERRAGATVVAGTPLYMSPEQACGARITTASDLYSFGLLLQLLVTERVPRRDGDRDEVLRAAAAGEKLPMHDRQRALTTLVGRLTSLAPADRPTAVETLETLDRILAAPMRRVRFAAAAMAIVLLLAGAVKYAIDVTDARRDAERRRKQAEALVSFMVTDLPRRLEPVGRLDVLDEAATRALAYFESLQPEELTGDELHRHALALAQLGDVRVKQGKLGDALPLFRQSLRFAAAAAAHDPSRDDWQLALSNGHFWVGDALRRRGDARGALAHFRAYYDVSARLAAKHPGDATYEAELSYGHSNLGSAYEALGDFSRAAQEYRTAVEVDRRRAADDPRDEKRRADLANSLNKLGALQLANGDLQAARRAFEEDVAIRRALAAGAPDDTRRASRLAVSLAYLGAAQLNTGEIGTAEATVREELAIAMRLAARDEQNLDWQRGRAVAQLRLSEVLCARGAFAEATRLVEAAAATLVNLTSTDARPTWQRDLAAVRQQEARLFVLRGDLKRAAQHATEAATLADRARTMQASDVIAVRILCDALAGLAELDRKGGREHAMRVVTLAVTKPYDRDSRILDAQARALAVLGRARDAEAVASRLIAAGYRRPDFVARSQLRAAPR